MSDIATESDFDKTHDYFKVTGPYNFGKYPYQLGLNTLKSNGEEFNPKPICGPGGLYFSDIKNIFEFLSYGDKVCIISIPDDAQVVKVENKYKADMIYIKEIRPLNLETIEFLVKNGADITAANNYALRWASQTGRLEIVKYLVENGADANVLNHYIERWNLYGSHLRIVAYLKEYNLTKL